MKKQILYLVAMFVTVIIMAGVLYINSVELGISEPKEVVSEQ